MDELKVSRLLRHGRSDFSHSVPNEVDDRGPGEIQILLAVSVPKIDPFAANCGWKSLAERAAHEGRSSGRRQRTGPRHARIIRRRGVRCQNALLAHSGTITSNQPPQASV